MKISDFDARKKNLVLDIDFTILDTDVFNSTTLTPSHWCRPNLHAFLEAVYPHYNIIVWSATGNGHVQHKLLQCGALDHPRYKLVMLVDYGAMIRIRVRRRQMVREFNTKPLAVLWGLWPEYMHRDNTVIVDDHRRSFVMNHANGIHIVGYRSQYRHQDCEFRDLTSYLLTIKDLPSLRQAHHDYWREVARGIIPLSAVLAPDAAWKHEIGDEGDETAHRGRTCTTARSRRSRSHTHGERAHAGDADVRPLTPDDGSDLYASDTEASIGARSYNAVPGGQAPPAHIPTSPMWPDERA